MQPMRPGTFRSIRLAFFSLAFLALLVPSFLLNAAAHAADQPPAQAATSTNGYWKFDSAKTFDKFTSPGAGSAWTPSFKDSSNGGTVVKSYDSGPADSTTSECSWSFASDAKSLKPGETLEVTLTVKSSITGLRSNISASGQDSMEFIDFTGNATSVSDSYSINGQQTSTAQGTGSASFVVQPGWTGAAKPATRDMHFQCMVAAVGLVDTTWHYVWVEGAAADATPTPLETPEGVFVPAPGAGVKLANLLTAAGVSAIVIGAILAAAGLLVLILTGGNKGGKPTPKPTGPKPPAPEPPKIRYALRASANSVDVYPGQPASVTFNAWRIMPDGASVPAIEAEIQVRVPESPAGLVAAPPSGMCSLTCGFSAPDPQAVATLHVLASALVGGRVMAQSGVQVCVLPSYALELKWEDPQQPALQVEGKAGRAWARVSATPPDPDNAPDVLAGKINVSVQGPNSDWIRQPLNPLVEYEKQWNAIAAFRPEASAELQPGNPALVAEFSAGRQQLFARLAIQLDQKLVLGAWVHGKKAADAFYQRKQDPPEWDFAEITAYFHAPDHDEKIVHPPFNLPDGPSFEAVPPILELRDHYESGDEPSKHVLKLALKDGTDLESTFAGVPSGQREIKVRVFAVDERGQEYADSISYRFRPTATFCVFAYKDDAANSELHHQYRGIEFPEEMELVANGDDCLELAGYFMATDEFAKNGPNPDQRLNIGEVSGVDWRSPQDAAELGAPQPEAANTRDDFLCFKLQSKSLLESTPARLEAEHVLVFKLGLRSDVPVQYSLESESAEVKIEIQYLRLRLWVVPGARRHSSAAVGYLDLQPSRQPLGKQEVFISIGAPGSMSLDLDGSPAVHQTLDQGTDNPAGAGSALWALRYCGITWANMPAAEFEVRIGLEDPPEARWQAGLTINVGANLRGLLSSLSEAATPGSGALLATRLNNPSRIALDAAALKDPLNMSGPIPEVLRDCMEGPIWNMTHVLASDPPFVCTAMRNAIIEWLLKRRFFELGEPVQAAVSRMQSMNGLDFGHYAIVPAHVWAGIFPAGARRFEEYRAIDPWWAQKWNPAWKEPDQLLTQNDEELRAAAFVQVNRQLALGLVNVTPALALSGALKAVEAWLNGAPPEQAAKLLGGDLQDWWQALRLDSDCLQDSAQEIYSYASNESAWLSRLIKDLG
jgi:hypothetical protein